MIRLLKTDNNFALTVVRLTLAAVYFPHGAQKLLGWFGGRGFIGTIHTFDQLYHIPSFLVVLAIAAEFFGAIGLIIGFCTRAAAFGIAVTILVAIETVTWQNGFFMNWAGKQHGEGIEFQILAFGICLALILKGAGAFSVDRLLSRKSAT